LIGYYTNRKLNYIRVPLWLAKILGSVLGLLPKPPLTRDQVIMLEQDNIVSENALDLHDLGITPTSIHAVLPTYMDVYTEHGQYSKYREV
ncbi:MAG: complex I NDUFA9 subunit family protein, partial [Endozoicomonadaceae bacterium]|nr:complex I NDUFA9 subunit family protein [Endozoicomonadaceae bacterium]